MRDHDYFVYIMTNDRRSVLYTGVTNDLARRVSEHQSGQIKGFTQRYRVHSLVYFERFRYIQDAIAAEKRIKGWTVAKKRELIVSMNAEWNDLSGGLRPSAGETC